MKNQLKKIYLQTLWHLSKLKKTTITPYHLANKNIIPNNDLDHTLILVPHADDEWIGCSQVIKQSKKCTLYYFNFLGNHYNPENEKIRLNELKQLQALYGFTLVISESRDNHEDLKQLLQNNQFSSIYAPSPIDWHPEHVLVNEISLPLIKTCTPQYKALYFYHISVPHPQQMPVKFLPLSKKDAKEKINTFDNIYPSQKNVPIRRMIIQNKLSTKKSSYYALEIFAILPVEDWEKLLAFVKQNYEPQIKPLMHMLDFVIKTRNAVNEIYADFLVNFLPFL